MPSRIVMNGKTVVATRDWRKMMARRPAEKIEIKPVVEPLKARSVGAPFYCPEDDLNYRVVGHVNPLDGWCLATQLMKLYGVTLATIHLWARMGLIDPVMELHSPTKRYCVRDHAKLLDLAKAIHAKEVERKASRRTKGIVRVDR